MKTFFVIILVSLILFTAGFYYVVYTPALINKYGLSLFEKYFKDATLKTFHVGGQQFQYPNTMVLDKVNIEIEWKEETYQLDAEQIRFAGIWQNWKLKKCIVANLQGVSFLKRNIALNGATLNIVLNFNDQELQAYEGQLTIGQAKFTPYQLERTSFNFQGQSGKEIKLYNIESLAYGGQIKGEVRLTFGSAISEILWLEFSGIKTKQLQTVSKTPFSQIDGVVDGTFRLSRAADRLQVFALIANMSKGGAIDEPLMRKIVSYMTDEEARYNIETILEDKKSLKFESAEFRILNTNENLAGVTVTLENKRQDWRMQETINIDISRILKRIALKI